MSDTERLLLRPKEAAKLLAVSDRTLWSLTAGGKIPYVRIGKLVRYSREAIEEWIRGKQLN